MNRKHLFRFALAALAVTVVVVFVFLGGNGAVRSAPVAADAARRVGEIVLPYANEVEHTVYIDDISPDAGSTAQDENGRYGSRWGIMNALSLSHAEMGGSPACAYSSDNGGTLVEHIAAVNADGHPLSFYQSADNDWKAVNLFEKTGVAVVPEQPTCWTADTGDDLLENIAARRSSGHVHVFTWHAGADWQSANLSSMLGYYAVGPLTSWNAPSGKNTVEHVAFRTQDSDLVLYWRFAGQTWHSVNVSDATGRSIAGDPAGWKMNSSSTERLAATAANKHLIVFTYTPGAGWSDTDVSDLTGGQLVEGRVSAWDENGVQYIAARSPNDDLLLFSYDPIDATWSVQNLSAATGVPIANDPAGWLAPSAVGSMTTIAAPDGEGDIRTFSRLGGGSWDTADISAVTKKTTFNPIAPWRVPTGVGDIIRLAAPDPQGFMIVHTFLPGSGWSAVDVSRRAAGRIVYAGAPFAGLWTSRDYGVTWHQSTRPQPAVDETTVPGALLSSRVLDVIVSPGDYNRVLVAADHDSRTAAASVAGIYLSYGGGDTWSRQHTFTCPWGAVEAPSQIVVAPDDPGRFYAAGGCGIARSDDYGVTWTSLMTVANQGQRVWHLAVSAPTGAAPEDRFLVACGDSRIWVSRDDGQNWREDTAAAAGLPNNFCLKTRWGHGDAAHLLALDPDDPSRVYLAYEREANGPAYFHDSAYTGAGDGVSCNNPVVYDANNDNDYDANESVLWGRRAIAGAALLDDAHLKFRDRDGDNTLDSNEAVVNDADDDDVYDDKEHILRQAANVQVGDALADDARIKYVDEGRPFGTRGCGEGSLWQGDLSDFLEGAATPAGRWSQLPGPPVYWGAGDSGATYVFTHPTPEGTLVFFSDQGTVHVAAGTPAAGGWHRLDGGDASAIHRSGKGRAEAYVHADPQGFTVSPDFTLSLKTVTDQPFPYNQNSELDKCGGGRLWVSNDGGIYHSDDCGATKERWRQPESGLNTLVALNILGAASLDRQPHLYFGSDDNDDFYSMDAGQTWKSAYGACGDCDTWFGDLYQPNRVLALQPRWNGGAGSFAFFTTSAPKAPDAGLKPSEVNYLDGVRPYAISHRTGDGYRPAVQTIPMGTPPAQGDYVTIQRVEANEHYLLRANDQIDTSGLEREGARIPTRAPNNVPADRHLWVQAAGGHTNTEFYLGDGTYLWHGSGAFNSWEERVPNSTLTSVWRHFANPYDASLVFAIGPQGVYRSTDQGRTWQQDMKLESAVTAGGDFALSCSGHTCPLNDMVFDPTHPHRYFAAGLAGVFFTADGQNWFRLLDTRAMPGRPRGLWFDPISGPDHDTLYVALFGRGILRLHPIPRTAPQPVGAPPLPPPPPTPTATPAPPGSGASALANGDFERGLSPWKTGGNTALAPQMAHGSGASARLGFVESSVDTLEQTAFVPCEARAVFLDYYYNLSSADNHPSMDTFAAMIAGESTTTTLQSLTEESTQDRWLHALFDVSDYACQEVTVRFTAAQNHRGVTAFYVDDVRLRYYDGAYTLNLPLLLKEK